MVARTDRTRKMHLHAREGVSWLPFDAIEIALARWWLAEA